MSQEKVDRYKQEKYNRKHTAKKRHIKKILASIGISVGAVAFIVYLGYSVAVSTGWYTLPTDPVTMSKTEIASLRQKLIDNNDPNVRGDKGTTSKASESTSTVKEPITKNTSSKKKSKESVTKNRSANTKRKADSTTSQNQTAK